MMCDEMKKVKTLNYSLKASKAHQEEENFTEEDLLRTAENSLKIQLKDEANIRTVLQVIMNTFNLVAKLSLTKILHIISGIKLVLCK